MLFRSELLPCGLPSQIVQDFDVDVDFDFAVDFGFSVGVTVRVFGAGGPAASAPWTFENIQPATIHAVNTICPVLYFFVNIIPFCSNTYVTFHIYRHTKHTSQGVLL